MVLFILYVKADLENVKELVAPKNHQWCIDVRQSNGEEVREGVFVSEEHEHEVSGSRGTANFLLKWHPSERKQCQLDVKRDVKNITRTVKGEDSGEFVPIVGFECRGLEPIKWAPGAGFDVISSTQTFEDVDLSDDWADFDEEASESVGIYNLEYKFEVAK